jgi:hypothetical protein
VLRQSKIGTTACSMGMSLRAFELIGDRGDTVTHHIRVILLWRDLREAACKSGVRPGILDSADQCPVNGTGSMAGDYADRARRWRARYRRDRGFLALLPMQLELSDEEAAPLLPLLNQTIAGDRYPLSPRIRVLPGIRASLPGALPARTTGGETVDGARARCGGATAGPAPRGINTPVLPPDLPPDCPVRDGIRRHQRRLAIGLSL